MKKTRFFNKYQLILTLILVSCSLFLFACQDPYTQEFMLRYTPQPVPEGKGSVTLIVDETDARTISPNPDSVPIAAYTITFLEHGTSTALETFDRLVADMSEPFYLVPGTYDIQVIAYTDEERTKAAAQSEPEEIIVTEGTNVNKTVYLNFIVTPSSNGTFRWEITVPSGLSSASMKITPLNTSTGTAEQTITFTGTPPFTGSRTLKTGYYQITFKLKKDDSTQEIIFREFLHVFDNVESFFSKVFTEAHFNNIQYTVTFDFDDGSTGSLYETYLHGDMADNYTPAVNKPTPAGLYLGTPPGNCSFAGWYHGDTQWVFTDPVTGNMTLTAHWTAADLVDSVAANNVAAAINYINSSPGAYTLLMGANASFSSATTSLNTNGSALTITGQSAMRTITNSATLTVTNSAALTVGNNITFSGNGDLIIYTGSSITLSGNAVINSLTLNATSGGNSSVTINAGWSGSVASLNLHGDNSAVNNVIGFWYDKTMPKTVLQGGGLSAATVAKFTLGNFKTSAIDFKPITESNPPNAPGGYKISTDTADIGTLVAISYEARIITGSNQGDYITLTAALTAASNGTPDDPTEIVILLDITAVQNGTNSYAYIIPANKNIKLNVEDGKNITITAAAGGFRLFSVSNASSSLTLGPTASGGTLTLSGGGADEASNRQGVYVNGSGRSLTMKNGVTITGFKNSSGGGGVNMYGGTFNMSGGTISDNTATQGGSGVYVLSNGTFNMSGGTISDNNATSSGGGVYVSSGCAFNMSGNSKISDNTTKDIGGGVYVQSGTFNMSGNSKISDNTAEKSGGGVYIISSTFTMDGGEISGNNATSSGGGVVVNGDGCTFTMSGNSKISDNTASSSGGGGVSVANGTLFTMNGGEISGNIANYCGGVYVSGTFNMIGGTISDNTASSYCGGVYVSGTFNMSGGTISDNNATTGGGVYVGGTFNMSGGTISDNNATTGGGVYVSSSGNTFMNGGDIKNNTASNYGGGVYVDNGTFTMNTGTISGNTAEDSGGGVYVNYSGKFNMSGGDIKSNTAASYGGGVFVYGTFTMSNGTIAGNRATGTNGRGGGVYVYNSSSSTFTMNGGTIYGTDAPSGFAPNTANGTAPNGAAFYKNGGTTSYGGAYASNGAITTTDKTMPPLSGALITITFAQITDAAPNITGPTISRTGTGGYQNSATLTINGSGLTNISWEITGTGFTGAGITGTGTSFTLNATDSRYNQVGDHHLTLIVYKDGVLYNKTIIFTIVN